MSCRFGHAAQYSVIKSMSIYGIIRSRFVWFGLMPLDIVGISLRIVTGVWLIGAARTRKRVCVFGILTDISTAKSLKCTFSR